MTDLSGILTPRPSAFIAQNEEEQGILDRYAARGGWLPMGSAPVGSARKRRVGEMVSPNEWVKPFRLLECHPWIIVGDSSRSEYERIAITASLPWMTHFYRIAVAD